MNTEHETQESLWKVEFSSKAEKQKGTLPERIDDILSMLVMEIKTEGPVQPEWLNYSKLAGTKDVHHCHLNAGKPRYVAVWKVINRTVRIVEFKFVGTHGKVRYNKIK